MYVFVAMTMAMFVLALFRHRYRHHVDIAVSNASNGHHRVRKSFYLGNRAPQNGDFQTVVMIKVNVCGRHGEVVVIVV